MFGAFSPVTGDKFLIEHQQCNAQVFERFLKEFSEQKPNEFKIIVLDNAAFHKAKKISIPENIALVFQPPYSPELNPAEQIWAWYKRDFTNKVFDSIPKVVDFFTEKTKQLSENIVKSIARYEYIFSNYWTIY